MIEIFMIFYIKEVNVMSKKIIVYGSSECPPCVRTKELLCEEKIHYGFVDVLQSLAHLKKFMNVRDANPDLYKEVIENGGVGIPTVVIDDEIILVEEITKDNIHLLK